MERESVVSQERRRNLLPVDGSCPVFCSVHASCVGGNTRSPVLDSRTSRKGPGRHTTRHFVRFEYYKLYGKCCTP